MNRSTSSGWVRYDPTFAADAVSAPQELSAWTGHRWFAYDLLRFGDPNAVVELGTHMGNSLFAFAQAVADGGLSTRLHAVDTWEGDEHAGVYGPEVLGEVKRVLGECYPGAGVELHQMLFEDARTMFDEGSVDIVHIDGLHTYEAVKSDYEMWLPVLADGGVMLFHDIAGYSDFGSKEFWQEICQTAPHLAFDHSHGLGVLFPKGTGRWQELVDQNHDDLRRHYEVTAAAALVDRLRRTTGARSNIDATWELERLATEVTDKLAATEAALASADERERNVREVLAEHAKVEAVLQNLQREHAELQAAAQARFDELEDELRRTQAALAEADRREASAQTALRQMGNRYSGAVAGMTEVVASLGRLDDILVDEADTGDRATPGSALAHDVDHLLQDPDLLRERLQLVECAADAAAAEADALERRADEAEARATQAEQMVIDLENTITFKVLGPARAIYGRGRRIAGR